MEGIAFFTLHEFDLDEIVRSLTTIGIISIPLLQEQTRQQLQREAEQFNYAPEIKTIGATDQIVKTEYDSCDTFAENSLYTELTQQFQTLLNDAIAQTGLSLFETPLQFNSMVLQRYRPEQLGITPHRDSLRAINLICVFNISGHASFYRCDDRSGAGAIAIDTTPGHVILMRAPGFLGLSDRPFHYVTEIRSTRYSLGLRQRIR
ncbi:hypothetical protein [Thermocoleostomius sinensis]|uniref:Fe2OG dioxygenase domain-containing protein n=1 Tax=Thermocoleostomius sinensis A174 TaxID=2016057 RepID=A0A9E8Z9E8_9CYAN|nr:hypothetical protein [Thermocoleostomius sinensis]WAL58960.1 hypothetical protein OXH18_17510 [Thermocoleostomius sinensis A174]